LEEKGHEVLEAPRGETGLQLFRARAPDVVLTDILMPGKDGLETILALHQDDPQVKIITMAGDGIRVSKENLRQSANDFGACRTPAKPFSCEELVRAVNAVLTLCTSRGLPGQHLSAIAMVDGPARRKWR